MDLYETLFSHIGAQNNNEDVTEAYNRGALDYERAFWAIYQNNGKPQRYMRAFWDIRWTNEIFKPYFDIISDSSSASGAFYATNISGDLVELLTKRGKELYGENHPGLKMDFSQSGDVASLFSSASKITHVPVIDVSNSTTLAYLFANCSSLKTIDGLVLNAEKNAEGGYGGAFSCAVLEEISDIQGYFGGSVTFKTCPMLNKETIKRIVKALLPDIEKATLTLSKQAVDNAFTTEEWDAFVQENKPAGWTISLA